MPTTLPHWRLRYFVALRPSSATSFVSSSITAPRTSSKCRTCWIIPTGRSQWTGFNSRLRPCHHAVPYGKLSSACSTGWFSFGMDASVAQESALTPSRILLVSLLSFGVFSHVAYQKYVQKRERARQHGAMREEEVRAMRGPRMRDLNSNFFQTRGIFINEKSRLLP